MSNIIKYYGPPGTGKTRTLVKCIDTEISQNNVFPEHIAYVTFTKREAKHGKQIVLDKGYDYKDLVWFRTIHSACYKLLELEKENVIQEKHKEDFFKSLKMDYVTKRFVESSLETQFLAEDTAGVFAEGNLLLSVIWWCMNNMPLANEPLRHYGKCPLLDPERKDIIHYTSYSYEYLKTINIAWKVYKTAHNLYDFVDMLVICYQKKLVPPIEVLIVDEVQDLSPLQWCIMNIWISRVTRVYLAGDYNQAIYVFAGARPDLFIDYPGTEILLSVTHRLGKNILYYAKSIINDNRLSNLVSCNNPSCGCPASKNDGIIQELTAKGVIRYLKNSMNTDKLVYCLLRTNYLVDLFCKDLMETGIPFHKTRGGQIWTERLCEINNIYQKLRMDPKSWSFEWSEFVRIIECYPLKSETFKFKRGLKTAIKKVSKSEPIKKFHTYSYGINLVELFKRNMVTYLDLYNCLEEGRPTYVFNPDIFFDLSKLTDNQQLIVKNLAGQVTYKNIKIIVSTMHKIKGQESDSVIVFDELTKTVIENLSRTPSALNDERRVFYVACTRTMESLYIIRNYFNYRYNFGLPRIKSENIKTIVSDEAKIYQYLLQNPYSTINDISIDMNMNCEIITAVLTDLQSRGQIYNPKADKYMVVAE